MNKDYASTISELQIGEHFIYLCVAHLVIMKGVNSVDRKEIVDFSHRDRFFVSKKLKVLKEKGLIELNATVSIPIEQMKEVFGCLTDNIVVSQTTSNDPLVVSETTGCCSTDNNVVSPTTNVVSQTTNEGLHAPNSTLSPLSPSSLSPTPPIITPPIIPLSQTTREREQDLAEQTEDLQLEGDVVADVKSGEEAYFEEQFETWWSLFPRKINKQKARAKYIALLKSGVTPAELRDGIIRSCRMWEATGTNLGFIPHATTWLNGSRWLDEAQGYPQDKQIDSRLATSDSRGGFEMFSNEQEQFLAVYLKRPRNSEAFNTTWNRVFMLEPSMTVEILSKCATYSIEELRRIKGDLSYKKTPENWLGDCDYKEFIDKATRAVEDEHRRKVWVKEQEQRKTHFYKTDELPEGAKVWDPYEDLMS